MKFIRRKRNMILHMIMAFLGGGTAIYSIMMRGNFGQAQTANLTELVAHIVLGESWYNVFCRIIAFILFMSGLAITHSMKEKIRSQKIEMICWGVEAVCIFIAGAIPKNIDNIEALWPVFFMTGFQWGVFSGADGFNCSTIFCSNNCRQALYGWMDFARTKKHRSFRQGRFYTLTVISFYIGAFYAGYMNRLLGIESIRMEILPVFLALVVWFLSGSLKQEEHEPFTEGPQNLRRGSDEL